MIEYRIHWEASSNITFQGESDWLEWDDPEETEEGIKDQLYRGANSCDGLAEALEASGFDWYVETRVTS